ncbi:TetR family transcriptional regulator [Streptomyces niveus]
MHGVSAGPHVTPGFRTVPVQRRGAARLARILDACAELLDETGYEELSTRAVATRAGVPIGSVYRFFGNKRALADALARRDLDCCAARVERRPAAIPAADWRSAIGAVLDEYLAMKRTVPGFGPVDFGTRIPAGPPGPAPAPGADLAPAAVPDANDRVADRLAALLAAQQRRAPDAALRRTVLVAVEAADALLQLAFRADASGDPDIIAETRELVCAYLARTLG